MRYSDVPMGVSIQALIVRDGKTLLGKKRVGPGAGFLDLPGGFVDPKETLETALRREVKEETNGCKVIKHKYFFSIVQYYADRQILTVVFLCEIEGEPQDSDEMNEFEWVSEFQWVSREIPLSTEFNGAKIALKKYFSSSKSSSI